MVPAIVEQDHPCFGCALLSERTHLANQHGIFRAPDEFYARCNWMPPALPSHANFLSQSWPDLHFDGHVRFVNKKWKQGGDCLCKVATPPGKDEPPAQLKLSPAEFTRMLLEGTRAHGLHWKTIEDLFEMAMRQGMPE